MMSNWRRQKGDLYNPEFTTRSSDNKKPPLGNRQPTVPSWEKKFCKSVGCVPWYKIMEMKRYFHLYDNVVHWNDSAGEEAFQNAKNRFYAKIHSLPCDISLPDPDIYIDEIDWNSQIDPELLLDLDREPIILNGEKHYAGIVILDSLLKDQGFSSSGWGDCEEKVKKDDHCCLENKERGVKENGWGDFGDNMRCWDESKGDSGWGDGWNSNNSWGQNRNEDGNIGEWEDGWNSKNSWGWNQNENNNRGEWGDGWNSKNNNRGVGNIGEWGDGWNSKNSWGWNQNENNNRGDWGDGWNSKNSWGWNQNENNNRGEWGDGWNINNSLGGNWNENNDNRGEWEDGWNSNNSQGRYKTVAF
ncbi:hypothetical protein LguiB_033448 [Lonicera macranthoides]